jgi:hypothetical protein
MNTTHTTEERLQMAEDRFYALINDSTVTVDRITQAQEEIARLKAERKREKRIADIKRWNIKEDKRRETLRKLLALQFPQEDITNMDGSIHATKGKKVAGLMELQEELWRIILKFDPKTATYKEAKTSGETFRLVRTEYKYNEQDTHHPFETFKEACEYNGIRPEPLKVNKALKNADRILTEAKKLRKHLEQYSELLKSLDRHDLVSAGVISEQQQHHYHYY